MNTVSFTDNFHKPHCDHLSAMHLHDTFSLYVCEEMEQTERLGAHECLALCNLWSEFSLIWDTELTCMTGHNSQTYKQVMWLGYPPNTSEPNTKSDYQS